VLPEFLPGDGDGYIDVSRRWNRVNARPGAGESQKPAARRDCVGNVGGGPEAGRSAAVRKVGAPVGKLAETAKRGLP